MKTYFVKAIPREGNIGSGDSVFFKINGKWIGPADFDSMLGPQIEDVRRAVFYLCSRDIKVGDTATEMLDNGDFQDFEIHTENDIYPEFIKAGLQFKIIDPVSPEALQWVKEDDEFDEYEHWWFSKRYAPQYHRILKVKPGSSWDKELEQEEVAFRACMIKCPNCKRFH
jgi:hypothetical protein